MYKEEKRGKDKNTRKQKEEKTKKFNLEREEINERDVEEQGINLLEKQEV